MALAKELKFRKRTVGDCCLPSRDDLRMAVKPEWQVMEKKLIATLELGKSWQTELYDVILNYDTCTTRIRGSHELGACAS